MSLGDGGPATDAQLTQPVSLALSPRGDLLIADQATHCIRKVDGTTGIISTVAGQCVGDGGPGGRPDSALDSVSRETLEGDSEKGHPFRQTADLRHSSQKSFGDGGTGGRPGSASSSASRATLEDDSEKGHPFRQTADLRHSSQKSFGDGGLATNAALSAPSSATIEGRTRSASYDGPTRRITSTSPESRTSTAEIDPQGRLTDLESPTSEPL